MSARRMYVPAIMLPFFVLAGCGGGGDSADTGGAPAVDTDAYVVPAGEAAVIAGVVNFQGAAPAPVPVDMSDEPACADKHPGGATRQAVVVNGNNTLRNVFVYVKEGLGDRRFASPTESKVMDQDGCVYVPHVLGVQTGQPIIFRNSDGLLHNINAQPQVNRSFNMSQPRAMDSPPRNFAQQEVMIPVRCDVHGWMESYIGVVAHPYFAVTGEDGSFRLENLPPGNYTIEAWHERYGTQTMQVTVAAQETGETSFTFSDSMAGAHVPLGAPIDPHDHGRVATAHGAH